jgi:hypothetical protein
MRFQLDLQLQLEYVETLDTQLEAPAICLCPFSETHTMGDGSSPEHSQRAMFQGLFQAQPGTCSLQRQAGTNMLLSRQQHGFNDAPFPNLQTPFSFGVEDNRPRV